MSDHINFNQYFNCECDYNTYKSKEMKEKQKKLCFFLYKDGQEEKKKKKINTLIYTYNVRVSTGASS